MSHARRSLVSLPPLLLLGLLCLAGRSAAEPPPTFDLEWSVVPITGATSVPLGITTDPDGNVCVTQDSPERLMSFTGEGSFRFVWGLASLGCLAQPFSITLDEAGFYWVADFRCNRIQKFDPNRVFVSAVGGFFRPGGVAAGPGGVVYVADTFNHRVVKLHDSGVLLTWGTFGDGPGQFNTPFDVAVDGAGNVYVLDSFNQRVQVFTSSGVFLRSMGEPGFGADHLIQPVGLDVDGAGNVYVADTGNHQIVKFSPAGQRLVAWGGRGSGPGQMIAPNDLAADDAGHVFVVDSGNKRIQRFSAPVSLTASLHVEPRTINTRSGGRWIMASIEPPTPYTPADIDVASLSMNGVAVDPSAPVDVTDVDGDGVLERTVRFSREAIAATAPAGATTLDLLLTGTVAGQAFSATDQVRVVGNGDILTWDPGLGRAVPVGDVFELHGIAPNPARAGLPMSLSFRATSHEPAFAEVLDLSGRRMARLDLMTGVPGVRTARMAAGRKWTPGVYLVRIVQGSKAATSKLAVIE